jgi:hypothetical protein
MPKDDDSKKSGAPGPAPADPAALSGKWTGGPPQIAVQPQDPPNPFSPVDPATGGRLAPKPALDASRSGSDEAGTGGMGGIDLASLQAAIAEAVGHAINKNNETIEQSFVSLSERIDALANHPSDSDTSSSDSSDDGGGGGGGGGDDGSEDSSDESESSNESSLDGELAAELLADKELFVGVNPKTNPHWGAAKLSDGQQHQPHRFDLYGNPTWMSLTKGGSDTSGVLANAQSYLEPLSLYLQALTTATEQLAANFAAGELTSEELLTELVAVRNSAKANHGLANVARSVIVAKAKALRPGASSYDKLAARHIERVLDNSDYAPPDTAAVVKKIKSKFARKASRSDMENLAKKAGSGGGASAYNSDSSSDDDDDDEAGERKRSRNKRKREKARERKKAKRAEAEREQRAKDEKAKRKAAEREAGKGGKPRKPPPAEPAGGGSARRTAAPPEPKPKHKKGKGKPSSKHGARGSDGDDDDDDYV